MPGEYIEDKSEPQVRHVHCIGPTLVGVFDTGSEAIKAHEAYGDTVVIHIGENQSKVNKSDIEVMSENEYMKRM